MRRTNRKRGTSVRNAITISAIWQSLSPITSHSVRPPLPPALRGMVCPHMLLAISRDKAKTDVIVPVADLQILPLVRDTHTKISGTVTATRRRRKSARSLAKPSIFPSALQLSFLSPLHTHFINIMERIIKLTTFDHGFLVHIGAPER